MRQLHLVDALELYDGPAPGSEDWTHSQQGSDSDVLDTEVTANVVAPTLIPVLPPAGTGNGAAVVVAPGGGFHILSIQSEGLQVAERLAAHGIAAFVLVYRLVPATATLPGKWCARRSPT